MQKRRPTTLQIAPPDNKQFGFSPGSIQYNVAIIDAASNLQAAFNGLLRSPAPSTECRSPSVEKSLPGRPRSTSTPSGLVLPVELPGSLLLDNQGFPDGDAPVNSYRAQEVLLTTPGGLHSHETQIDSPSDHSQSSFLRPQTLSHTKSAPNLKARHIVSTMKSIRSGNGLNAVTSTASSSATAQMPRPSRYSSTHMASRPHLDLHLTDHIMSAAGNTTKLSNVQPREIVMQRSQSQVEGQPLDARRRNHRDDVSVVCFFEEGCLLVQPKIA